MKHGIKVFSYQLFITSLVFFVTIFNNVCASEENYEDMTLDQLVEVNIFASSVISAHIHKQGEFMFSVDSTSMRMEGHRNGTDKLSTDEVLQDFMISPIWMTMEMNMFHIMYAPTDDLTFMIMLMHVEKEMKHRTQMGSTFVTKSSGLGDSLLKVNYIVGRQETETGEQQFGVTLGLSIPTGSIDEKYFLPALGGNSQLPYPMQLGSGTYDPQLGALYLGFSEQWYWGGQGTATIRFKKNDNGYKLGNRLDIKAWLNHAWNDNFSSFMQLHGEWLGNIDGEDKALPTMMKTTVPTADPNRRGRKVLSLVMGIDYYFDSGLQAGNRIGLSYGKPLYQNLEGPQLEVDYLFDLRWQFTF